MGGDGELAGGDEALLVREGERDATLEGPERCLDAGEADDRVQDDIRLARVEELAGRAAHLGVLDAERGGKRAKRLPSRHERAELEIGVRADDLDRLCGRSSRWPRGVRRVSSTQGA